MPQSHEIIECPHTIRRIVRAVPRDERRRTYTVAHVHSTNARRQPAASAGRRERKVTCGGGDGCDGEEARERSDFFDFFLLPVK